MSVHASCNVEHKAPTPDNIMRMALAFWQSKVLFSAVELGLFTALAKQPMTAGQVAEALGIHQRAHLDFLDALVSMGMLEREGDLYKNSPDADYYLDEAKLSYIGGFLSMSDARLYPSWGRLTDALRSGRPQNESSHSDDLFAALYADSERLKRFLSAMTGVSMPLARAIAEKFDWHKYQSFIDVGAAQGALPVEVAKRHEHLSGHGYDLPQVEPVFSEYVERHGLKSRLAFKPGDFFKDELPETDVIVMGHILHDWDLEQKQMLIRKAHRALKPGGAYIAYDAMIDPARKQNTFGLLMSLNMLVETHGGFDYTTADCIKWLTEAGFKDAHAVELSPTHSMVIGFK